MTAAINGKWVTLLRREATTASSTRYARAVQRFVLTAQQATLPEIRGAGVFAIGALADTTRSIELLREFAQSQDGQ